MPSRVLRNKRRVSLYLVPVMLGMFGVLFAHGLDHAPVLRGVTILLSVTAPLFSAGYILAHLRREGPDRVLLVAGIIMLMVGALVTVSGLSDTLVQAEYVVPEGVMVASYWLGLISLLFGMMAVLYSIVQTDEAIEEVGTRFKHLADQMGEGFLLASADGRIAMVNQRFLELTGRAESEIVGMSVHDMTERGKHDVGFPELVLPTYGQSMEYRCSWMVRGEERHFLISGKPLYNRRGDMAGTLATVRDITEHHNLAKRLERYTHGLQKLVEDRTQKLRQSEERFRNLLLYMREGFLTADADFRIRFANERICEMLEIRPTAIQGRDLFEFVDASGRARLLELFHAAQTDEDDRMQQEFTFLRNDGSAMAVMVGVAPIRTSDDEIEEDEEGGRYSLVVTDVTELKRMQHQLEVRANELQGANEELKMMDRAKDGFLSNVSHELKTPLATIRGYLEMLRDGSLGALPAPQASAIGVMERNAQRLGLLIDEMIEFSRMQIRGIRLSLGLFTLNGLVQDCVSSAQPQGAAKGISFEFEVALEVAMVWADRKRVAQVLSILLSNAVKFSHPGGRIRVEASRRGDGGLALAVIDEGIGIPAAFQARVFDKFFQIDSSHTRRYEGTGIGLSIAKSIAEAHGGTIALHSEPGKGSTFTLVIPRAAFDVRYTPHKGERLDGLRVLLAEDDEEARRAFAQVLENAGAATIHVRSGHECLRVANETRPDVMILCEMMADLSGAATYRKLREDTSHEERPVVVLGPTSTRGNLDLKGAFLLAKPFSPRELLAKIREACYGESPVSDAPAAVETPHGRASVLALDADPDFLAWLETGLQRRKIECYCVSDVNEALGVAEAHPPSLILLDVDATNGDTAELVHRLRGAEATREVPIYVITGLPMEYPEGLGLAGGLRKPFSIGEIEMLVRGLRSPQGEEASTH